MKANCTEPIKEINQVECETNSNDNSSHHGICAICRNKIVLQETALVKGCEHAYCVNCILKWASYKKDATCPQCKNPFEFLNIHRALDGSIHDYMFEESVHLLLRASWFKKPLIVVEQELVYEESEEYYYEEDEEEGEEDLDEVYLDRSGGLSLGNRRWGDNGYVRAGRQEARPKDTAAGTSRGPKKKEGPSKETAVGRRAKRALKREAADKAKQVENLPGLGPV
ncbi:RING/U-box superfamily protein [Striga asiatica]|uniref:RING/U-box superfamily protein n=1 Tax=Striga asiatica TaxID=4170 RepID=A0A5A7QAF8_STRAF|nr:RING/U-box superfamily protein [Striga asiatica]